MDPELHFGRGQALAGLEQVAKAVVRVGDDAGFDLGHLERHAQNGAAVVEAADPAALAGKQTA